MANPPLCVCNETRESLVCGKVCLIDIARTPFHGFARHVTEIHEAGLWLNPFRGFPQVPGLLSTEVVLLDRDTIVLECVPAPPELGIDDPNQGVASALVLPASTIIEAQIEPGDQLRFCNPQTGIEWSLDIAAGYPVGRPCCCFPDQSEPYNSPARTLQAQSAIMKLGTIKKQTTNLSPPIAQSKWFWGRIVEWVAGNPENTNRRRGTRSRFPNLGAYYWAGKTPKAFRVGDIGSTGFYLITKDRWELGTRIRMNLQRTDAGLENPDDRITVLSRVARFGSDGVGFEFVASTTVDPESGEVISSNRQSGEMQTRFLQRVTGEA